MMQRLITYIFICSALLCSCTVGKYLKPGERLYRGATIEAMTDSGAIKIDRNMRKELDQSIRPKTNKFLLGRPYRLWWWYAIGEPKKKNGFKSWLRNLLGEEPILSSRVNTAVTAQNMTAYLENVGYFHSTVKGDTINKNDYTSAVYKIRLMPQYHINTVNWVDDSTGQIKAIIEQQSNSSLLKKGRAYKLSDVDGERSRVDLLLKANGYYYFSPDYILSYADSTIGDYKVDIYFNVNRNTPEEARHPYKINQVMVFPNYTLLSPAPDTTRKGTKAIETLLIRDTVNTFTPALFKNVITYREGDLYSSIDQNKTLNRFINIGTFKFVKNRYEPVKDSIDKYRLNVYYYLTPSRKKSLQAEIDGFSKENRYLGSQVSINWKNRNVKGGAEQLLIKAYAGIEVFPPDTIKSSNNYRFGVEARLNLPRYLIPFYNFTEKNLYMPRTQLLLGYEHFIKHSFYAKEVYRLQYEYSWKTSANKQYVLAPVAITYFRTSSVKDSFNKIAALMPSVLPNVYSEIILASFYSYTYNTLNPLARHQWYLNATVEAAGNIAGLISNPKKPRDKSIFGTPFTQYGKFDLDVRYTKRFRRTGLRWANRIQIGIGLPYGNSAVMPLTKQYIIGGSTSLRGFSTRSLGPGSYVPNGKDQAYLQVIGGDYKFLLNTELRIPLVGRFEAAVFTDIGNIWTRDSLMYGRAGQLKADFMKEMAIASGIGVRIDANVLLLRLDIGFPIRKPFLPEGQRWIFSKVDLSDRDWRTKNLSFSFAIGYPF